MSCVRVSVPGIPSLPFGLTFTPPVLPPIVVGVDLCCKIGFTLPLPAIPIPAVVYTPAIVSAINAAIAGANAYLDTFEAAHLDCPLDD